MPIRLFACFAINKKLISGHPFSPRPRSSWRLVKTVQFKLARTSKSAKRGANLAFHASGLNLAAFLRHFRKFIRDRILRMMRACARILIKIVKTRGFMRDKFCVKFGLHKKSAFIKFSKKQRKFSRQKNLQTSGQISRKTSANLPFVSKR